MIVDPNIEFINELKRFSGSDLSTCMQCGSCSAVCDLSPEIAPFPRKEMIWSAWGLKEQLIADPDIWLCHHCGDCTTQCPRDVKPGEILAAVRQATWTHFSRPQFLSRWLANPVFLPLLILIPAGIIAAIIALAGTLKIPDGPVNYSAFFPHSWLNGSFAMITGIIILPHILSIRRFYKNLVIPSGRKKGKILTVIKDLFTHKRFTTCETHQSRSWSHILVVGGFCLLLFVTLFAILSVVMDQYPMHFWHPVKIAGNLAGLSLLIGLGMMAFDRIRSKEKKATGQFRDWFFLIMLFLLALSGMIVEAARF